jgi:hypothetical protein
LARLGAGTEHGRRRGYRYTVHTCELGDLQEAKPERGGLLLSSIATVPHRYQAGSRKAVFPDLEAQLGGEIGKG